METCQLEEPERELLWMTEPMRIPERISRVFIEKLCGICAFICNEHKLLKARQASRAFKRTECPRELRIDGILAFYAPVRNKTAFPVPSSCSWYSGRRWSGFFSPPLRNFFRSFTAKHWFHNDRPTHFLISKIKNNRDNTLCNKMGHKMMRQSISCL